MEKNNLKLLKNDLSNKKLIFNFNKKGGPTKITILHLASEMGYIDIIIELLEKK